MNEQEIIDLMRQLREKRNFEIDRDIEEKGKNNNQKVLNIKYLGRINWHEDQNTIAEKGIYLVIEGLEDKDGNIIEVERYYTEEGELLGGNNKSDQFDYIILSEKLADNVELETKLQQLDKQGIINLEEIEKEKMDKIAKVLGIREEELEKIAEIDTDKSVKDKEGKSLNENDIAKKGAKTYIDTNEKVTDRETIASLLRVEDKGYKKIAIVYSDKLQGNDNTTRFSFVGIKLDGTVEKIDTLQQRYGKNPTKNVTSINRDGTQVEDKQVQSIYQIKGEDENQLGVRIGPAGTIETSLIRTPRQDNQEALSIPIETTSTLNKTSREPMRLMDRQKNYSVKEEIQRAEVHKKEDCKEKITIKDIDDDPTNNTHEHVNEEYIQHCVDELMKDVLIEEVFTRREVEERIKNGIESKEQEKTVSQSIEDTKIDLQEDAIHLKTHEQQ